MRSSRSPATVRSYRRCSPGRSGQRLKDPRPVAVVADDRTVAGARAVHRVSVGAELGAGGGVCGQANLARPGPPTAGFSGDQAGLAAGRVEVGADGDARTSPRAGDGLE